MTNTGEALPPGTPLEEFEVERVLGAGGFGLTYLVRDRSLEVHRAVKEYFPRDCGTRRRDGTIGPRAGADAADYQWGLTRFIEEARILAQFDHRNLVRVYRCFEAWGTAYMVTDYVKGRTLAAEVEAAGPLPETRVRAVLDALTDGLSAVHAAGLLHRDIKPENVMVRPDGTPVLIDFGSARQAGRTLTAVLTPGYAPLEQYSTGGRQGPWTDIYGLGALAYWALTGKEPDDATERVPVDGLRPLAEAAAKPVSAALESAVHAALAVNDAARPQSLEEWRALLDVRPATPVDPWRRWLPGAAAVALAAVAAALAFNYRNPAPVESEPPAGVAGSRTGGGGSEGSESPGVSPAPGGSSPVTPRPEPARVTDEPPVNPVPPPVPGPERDAQGGQPGGALPAGRGSPAVSPRPGPSPITPEPAPAAATGGRPGGGGSAGRGSPAVSPRPGVSLITPVPEPDQRPAAPVPPQLPEREPVTADPVVIYRVPPVIPPEAREARVQGRVVVEALIAADGTVGEVRLLESVPSVDRAVIAAVEQWRFTPALRAGEPAPGTFTVGVDLWWESSASPAGAMKSPRRRWWQR